jgi:hypothetical protein
MTDLDTTTFNTPNGYVTTDFDAIPTINSLKQPHLPENRNRLP